MLAFELEDVRITEFGVGRDGGQDFAIVAADADVQTALRQMAQETWEEMQDDEDGPAQYDPGEKHGSMEYLVVPRGDSLESTLRALHDADNLPLDMGALRSPDEVFCYFARFMDGQGRRLTAMRRASQFKGVLKKRLLQIMTDTLKIVQDKTFALDNDFDVLIDSERTHIWRPSSFEFMGALRQHILNAVPTNVAAIQQDLSFMDFEGIEKYASTRPRAARYLASIRSQELVGVTREALVRECRGAGVKVEETNGRVTIADADIMGILEVLDRRRYQVELVPQVYEQFKATSRHRLDS